MSVETRHSNKDAHPGLLNIDPKQKHRTFEEVQAAQAEKDAKAAAKAAKAEEDANRIAYYEKEIHCIQEEAARTANHPLFSLTPDIAELVKKKKGPAKPKSVSVKKKNVNIPPPDTSHPMDVNTEVDEAQLPKPLT